MGMSNDVDSGDFERRSKRVFDDSVAALDAATRSQLTQARYRALEERQVGSGRTSSRWLLPLGSVAATALVVWLAFWQAPPPAETVQQTALGDLEILLGEEDLEMLDEELEFYGWLEEQPEFEGALDSVG
jgi:hypothetical protein